MSFEDYKGILLQHLKCFIFATCISQPQDSAITTLKKSQDLNEKNCFFLTLYVSWRLVVALPPGSSFQGQGWGRGPCLVHALGHLILKAEEEEPELLETYGCLKLGSGICYKKLLGKIIQSTTIGYCSETVTSS